MANPWVSALIAVFVWWFSTGIILMAVKRADKLGGAAHLRTVLWSLPILALGGVGIWQSFTLETVAGAYLGFLSALAIWGWIELAFLCGIITGPNMRVCPEGVPPFERFIRAWGTIAYSESLLVAVLCALLITSWHAPNSVGMWTFVVLFFARVSAKLNVYLGVPNINVEFLPSPMRHLASHFRIAPMNWFFPVGVTLLSLAFACWLERGYAQEAGSGALVSFTLLAAITGLAILEHWVMVLPIPDAKLWRWMVAFSDQNTSHTNRTILTEDRQ